MPTSSQPAGDRSRQASIRVVDLAAWQRPGPAPEGAVLRVEVEDLAEDLRTPARFGGALLALAGLHHLGREGFAVAVGESVVAGQATAARATVIARAPLHGRWSQGQFGSDWARRFARFDRVVILRGRAPWPDAVLRQDEVGRIALEAVPGLEAVTSAERVPLLEQRFGPGEVLRPGPAAHAGVRFANLSAGSDPPSFVGRGGLGAALADLGVSAWLVQAEPVSDHDPDANESSWVRALMQSPRLLARAAGERLQEAPAASWQATQTEGKHGCRGCPTPCGFTFRTEKQARTGARFSALEPLLRLVSDRGEGTAHELLAACNALGIDAREAGTALAGLAPRLWPQGGSEQDWIERLHALCLEGAAPAAFRRGVAALVEAGELAPDTDQVSQGEAHRAPRSIAERIAAYGGQRGAEPLRSYNFLLGDRADPERVRALVAPLHLPVGSTDPDDPSGKGRLLWWHENLVAGVDTLGICAFSVAGVLADGVLGLDEVAEAILPPGLGFPDSRRPAETLLAMGAHAVEWFQRLQPDDPAASDPPDLLPALEEYRSLRAAARTVWGSARLGAPLAPAMGSPSEDLDAASERPGLEWPGMRETPGGSIEIRVQAGPTMARRLPAEVWLSFAEPPTVLDVLRALAQRHPRAAPWLLAGGRPVPAVSVQGRWVQAEHLVPAGACVELVLALSGG